MTTLSCNLGSKWTAEPRPWLSTTLLCNTQRPAGQSSKRYQKEWPIMKYVPKFCHNIYGIPSLWAAALEQKRRCFLKIILPSNVTYNITRSADSLRDRPHGNCQKSFFLLMQISYPYIVWNNFPKFQENRASSFWDMRQSMCMHNWGMGIPPRRGGVTRLGRYPFRKIRKSQQYPY